MKKMLERMNEETPRFFRRVRNIGFTLSALGATLLAAPGELPAIIATIAEHLISAGALAGVIAQGAVVNDEP